VNRIAVRETYRSDDQTLTLFSGLRGEFGEGMKFLGRTQLRRGGEARLYGERSNWVLTWQSVPPCNPRAVIGQGFSRRTFRRVLRQMQ
jgi:hypothetical protein